MLKQWNLGIVHFVTPQTTLQDLDKDLTMGSRNSNLEQILDQDMVKIEICESALNFYQR